MLISTAPLLIVVFTITFFRLYCLMQKYHHYEFEANRRSMLAFYISMISAIIVNLALYSVLIDNDIRTHQDIFEFYISLLSRCHQRSSFNLQAAIWCMYIVFILQLPALTQSFIVIQIKSSKDILQGVSKLDYLLKLSVFQKYKTQRYMDTEQTEDDFRPSELSVTSSMLYKPISAVD